MKPLSFFQLNRGKWVTQRTIYKIHTNEIHSYQSEIIIDSNSTNDNQQIFDKSYNLHNANLFNSKLSLCIKNKFNLNNFQITIENFKDFNQTNFIKKQSIHSKKLFYTHANNNSYISVKNVVNNIVNFEKIWFVNSNLRLSVSLIEKNNKCIMTSFSSDIRIG
jgi:hypothetical protein|uniref:Chromophore lyase CpcS/CpeS homolog n=1 Tax=Kumanoa mahlacensis TaxID=1196387 RepID=A0A8K1YU75_9FLOR|nr:chromophore lyase [Kumanoa mahlacensis]